MAKTNKTDVYVIDFVNRTKVLSVTFLNNNSKSDKDNLAKVHEQIALVSEIKLGRDLPEVVETPNSGDSQVA